MFYLHFKDDLACTCWHLESGVAGLLLVAIWGLAWWSVRREWVNWTGGAETTSWRFYDLWLKLAGCESWECTKLIFLGFRFYTIACLEFLVGDLSRSPYLIPAVVLRLLLFYLTWLDSYLEEDWSAINFLWWCFIIFKVWILWNYVKRQVTSKALAQNYHNVWVDGHRFAVDVKKSDMYLIIT